MVAHKSSRDVLSQLHEQHAQDKKNDRMETGSFPVVRKKPKRPVKDGSARMRLMTSVLILIMCALLGYGYMIQINNADATYETLSEDELTRLISETGTQVQNLEQRKSELTNQLESLKTTANKTQERSASPSRTRRPTASSPVVCPRRARACRSASPKGRRRRSTRRRCTNSSRNCATQAPR